LLACDVAENPWASGHGDITKAWNRVRDSAQVDGAYLGSTMNMVRHKVNDMVTLHEMRSILHIGYATF
jgi:hypothetical protein